MASEEGYSVSVHEYENGVYIHYWVWDSDYDGNDFRYTYYISGDDYKRFVEKLELNGKSLAAAIEEQFGRIYWESKLPEFLEENDIHGEHTSYEDYPGGVDRTEQF